MEDTNKQIYQYLSDFWRFIKKNNRAIPSQDDRKGWDEVVDNCELLTSKYKTKDETLNKMFRLWMVAYLDYMSAVSLGKSIIDEQAEKIERSA